MPVYEYEPRDDKAGCATCRGGFNIVRSMHDKPLESCPQCGAAVRKRFSVCAVGRSESNFDDRAKASGFSKLKRLGKGEYEKVY